VRRNLFNGLLILLAILLAAGPIMVMRWALVAHATTQAEERLQSLVTRTLAHAEAVFADAADGLARVVPRIGETCDRGTRELLAETVAAATYLKSLLVLDAAGTPVCGSGEIPASFPAGLHYLPTRAERIAIAVDSQNDGQRATTHLRWTDGARAIVASLGPDAHHLDIVPAEWRATAIGSVTMGPSTTIGTLPAATDLAARATAANGHLLVATARSEAFPVAVTLSVPFEAVWASHRTLATLIHMGGGVMGLAFLAMTVQLARRRETVEDSLERALARDEFVPFYQPVFDIQSGTLVGCEVLIRWRKPDGTMIPPGAFIQNAEESGLAIPMTRRLMQKSRDEMGRAYAPRPQLKLAFNLFADHFSDFTTVEDIRDIFRSGGIRYGQIVLEVTERYPLPNLNRAKVAITGLQELGCRVALDDAGTGHGGLAYLQKLGMDQIKIDKLFVDTITPTSTTAPIVDSLVDLGRSLNMEIVAEGVETMDQLRYLKMRGVQCAQGFLFARPLPGPDYLRLIEELVPAETPAKTETEAAAEPSAKRRRAA